jgi:hypothetical protein
MKSRLRNISSDTVSYTALLFVCPGCISQGPNGYDGLHMLPVNSPHLTDRPSWDFDGNFEEPTLSPSILSRRGTEDSPLICHSFLRGGIFEYLSDSTHPLTGQKISIPDLPTWAENLS